MLDNDDAPGSLVPVAAWGTIDDDNGLAGAKKSPSSQLAFVPR